MESVASTYTCFAFGWEAQASVIRARSCFGSYAVPVVVGYAGGVSLSRVSREMYGSRRPVTNRGSARSVPSMNT
jgi:hypothetical protein